MSFFLESDGIFKEFYKTITSKIRIEIYYKKSFLHENSQVHYSHY